MNATQRKILFRDLWPAACRAQGWDVRDDARRHATTKYATGEESTKALSQHQVTALFCFLQHLADPTSVVKASAWAECEKDPVAYNRARQAKYWLGRAGYSRDNRLLRQRFGGTLPEGPFDPSMDPAAVDQLLLTARARAMAKRKPVPVADVEDDNCPF